MATRTTRTVDTTARLARARASLDGLSVGDAHAWRILPHAGDRWPYTDDTVMAAGIVEVLARHGHIAQDDLARIFARNYAHEPHRGYGPNTKDVLAAIGAGMPWQEAATTRLVPGLVPGGVAAWFFGRAPHREPWAGSLGNGAAMRAAPIGAYLAGDTNKVADQAWLSAEVTHAHPDGIAGAVAVALAAAWAWTTGAIPIDTLFRDILDRLPNGETRQGIVEAERLVRHGPFITIDEAVRTLGNGCPITSARTVPLVIWLVWRHFGDLRGGLLSAAAAGGDSDTICAMVGGVLASARWNAVPVEWIAARESLPPME